MAITRVGSTVEFSTNGTNPPNVNIPGDVTLAVNDVVVYSISGQSTAEASDFTNNRAMTRVGAAFVPNSSTVRILGTFAERITSGTLAGWSAGVQFSRSGAGTRMTGRLYVLRGVDPTTMLDVVAAAANTTGTNTASATGVTAPNGGYCAVHIGSNWASPQDSTVSVVPSGMTIVGTAKQNPDPGSSGVSRTQSVTYEQTVGPGATGTKTLTWVGTPAQKAGELVVFRAAPTGLAVPFIDSTSTLFAPTIPSPLTFADDFNRAGPTLGADWSQSGPGVFPDDIIQIISNTAQKGYQRVAAWNVPTITTTRHIKLVQTNVPASGWGPMLALDTPTFVADWENVGYRLDYEDWRWEVGLKRNGVEVANSGTLAPGLHYSDLTGEHEFTLEQDGADIRVYFDGDLVIDWTDPSPLLGAYVGFGARDPNAIFDSISGGDGLAEFGTSPQSVALPFIASTSTTYAPTVQNHVQSIADWLVASPYPAIAHRGAPDGTTRAEFSFDTYDNAVVDDPNFALEVSVWPTSDDVWVLNHNQTTGAQYSADLDIPTSTLASLQALTRDYGVTSEPMRTLDEFLDRYPDRVLFIENKAYAFSDGTRWAAFLDILEAADPTHTRIVFKAHYTATGVMQLAKDRGFITWAYFFNDTDAANLATRYATGAIDWVGLAKGTTGTVSQTYWDWCAAQVPPIPVVGHVVYNSTDWALMRGAGADMGMVNNPGEVPLAGGSSQSLSTPFISASSSLFNPSVTRGPVTVAAPHIASSAVVYAPTVTRGAVSVGAPFIASAAQLFVPAVIGPRQNLTAPAIASVAALFAPSVVPGSVSVLVPHIGSTSALFAPSLQARNTLTAPFISAASVVHAPTVTRGLVSLQAPFIASGAQLFPPVITTGGLTLILPSMPSVSILYGPSLVSGPISIAAPRIESTSALYAPTVAAGRRDLAAPFIASVSVTYSPSLLLGQFISLPALSSGSQLFGPSVTAGVVVLGAPFIVSGSELYDPFLRFAQTLVLPFIDSISVVYLPSIDGFVPDYPIVVGRPDRAPGPLVGKYVNGTLVLVAAPDRPDDVVIGRGRRDRDILGRPPRPS